MPLSTGDSCFVLIACNMCFSEEHSDREWAAVKHASTDLWCKAPKWWVEAAQRLYLTTGGTCFDCAREFYTARGKEMPRELIVRHAQEALPDLYSLLVDDSVGRKPKRQRGTKSSRVKSRQ